MQLTKHSRVQLIWVPGHEDIVRSETADQLARTESEHPFTGPEAACGISIGVAKREVKDWKIGEAQQVIKGRCVRAGLLWPTFTHSFIIHSR
jgi:hypothetical protein